MDLTKEQEIWKQKYINHLIAGGLARRCAEEDFHAGYLESGQCTIELDDDPEDAARDELSYMSEG